MKTNEFPISNGIRQGDAFAVVYLLNQKGLNKRKPEKTKYKATKIHSNIYQTKAKLTTQRSAELPRFAITKMITTLLQYLRLICILFFKYEVNNLRICDETVSRVSVKMFFRLEKHFDNILF